MDKRQRWYLLLFFILLCGFFAGSALPEVLHMGTGTYAGFFSMYSLQKYRQTEMSPWRLFVYVLAVRIRPLLFLWMSAYTAAGLLFHALYFAWISMAAGMLLALFVLKEGYEGMLLFCCCLLPQWIMYVTMWKMELKMLLERKNGKDLSRLGKRCGLCAVGAAVEAFTGTWIIKIFLQISG